MITGHHLHSADGEDVGEVIDVLGGDDLEGPPRWITVKTGWFAQRVVPFELVEQRHDGELVTSVTRQTIAEAPKVPVHLEPNGDDAAELRRHYALA